MNNVEVYRIPKGTNVDVIIHCLSTSGINSSFLDNGMTYFPDDNIMIIEDGIVKFISEGFYYFSNQYKDVEVKEWDDDTQLLRTI